MRGLFKSDDSQRKAAEPVIAAAKDTASTPPPSVMPAAAPRPIKIEYPDLPPPPSPSPAPAPATQFIDEVSGESQAYLRRKARQKGMAYAVRSRGAARGGNTGGYQPGSKTNLGQ